MLALGFVGKDGEYVGDVTETCEKEEEHAQAVGGLAAPIEDQLGQAGGDIGDSAEPSKELAQDVKFQGILSLLIRGALAAGGFASQKPPQHTSGDDHDHCNGVPSDRL